MRRHSSSTLLLATLLGGASLSPGYAQTVTPADQSGQSSSAPSQPSSPMPAVTPPMAQPAVKADADAADRDGASSAARMASDEAAFFEAHLAALHAGLALTPDQEKLWPALQQAIRGVADLRRQESRMARMPHSSGEKVAEHPAGTTDEDPIATLKQVSDRMLDHGRALGALADAAGPLYDELTGEQKRRLPVLLDGLTPRRGPVARMVRGLMGDLQDDEPGRRQDTHGGMRHGDRDQDRDGGPGEARGRSRMQHSDMDEDRNSQDEREARDRSSDERRGMIERRNDRFDDTRSLYGDRGYDRRDRPMRKDYRDEDDNGRND